MLLLELLDERLFIVGCFHPPPLDIDLKLDQCGQAYGVHEGGIIDDLHER